MTDDSDITKLSREDIQQLLKHPDAAHKVKVIEKLSSQYTSEGFTAAQVELADQIFRLLLKQAEIEVRKALSDNLMYSKNVPHDVALSLARDVEEVSLPMLEFSEVLTDNDLIEIIQSSELVTSHAAIANRSTVSESVSAKLVDTGNEEVVNTLLQNDSAKISEKSFEKVVNTFAESENIVDSMITRGSLPSKIMSTMTKKVSTAIQKKLEKKYESSFSDINNFFQESGEVAALKFLGMQTVDKEIMKLVDDLERSNNLEKALDPVGGMLTQLLDGLEQLGQITPLSALAMGHQTLFEISISRLTGVAFPNVRRLAADRKGGLKALYKQAELPPKLFDAVFFITDIIRKMDKDAVTKGTSRAKDDLHLMMKNIINESKGKKIRNLAHFISVVQSHIERSLSEW